MSEFGTLLPVETTHRELRSGDEVAENKFTTRDFHRFGARGALRCAWCTCTASPPARNPPKPVSSPANSPEAGMAFEAPATRRGRFSKPHCQRVKCRSWTTAVSRTGEKLAKGEPLVLMGSSLGGYLAALYAARHPSSVDRLILLAPAFRFSRTLARPPEPPGNRAMEAARLGADLSLRRQDRTTPGLSVPRRRGEIRCGPRFPPAGADPAWHRRPRGPLPRLLRFRPGTRPRPAGAVPIRATN